MQCRPGFKKQLITGPQCYILIMRKLIFFKFNQMTCMLLWVLFTVCFFCGYIHWVICTCVSRAFEALFWSHHMRMSQRFSSIAVYSANPLFQISAYTQCTVMYTFVLCVQYIHKPTQNSYFCRSLYLFIV